MLHFEKKKKERHIPSNKCPMTQLLNISHRKKYQLRTPISQARLDLNPEKK
jgi:hypothetical protein